MDLEKYHLAQGPSIRTETIPGEKTKQLLDAQEKYESNNRSYPRSFPLAPKKAKGSIIEDVDGNQYMDFFSLCGVVNVGHGNEEVLAATKAQMEELIHAMDFPTETKLAYIKNLNQHLPESLNGKVKINFCGPTGADAVEAAMKLARLHTKRNLIISFQGSYHGMTTGALSVTSNRNSRKGLAVLNQGHHFAPFSYCYRCPVGKEPDSCKIECASHLRNLLENPHSGVDKPAAVLVEPIQGEGGIVVPKPEFHQEVRNICDEHGVMLIHDEVQAGFYRTGKMLSSEHFDVTPDVVVMSKGVGGIGMPCALLVIKKEFDTWTAGTHAGTFRGNQPGMAAGNAALNFIEEHQISQYVTEAGALLFDGLNTIKKQSPFIGDVRGAGLFLGVEYVKNKKTKEPYPEFCVRLRQRLFENGVLIEIGGYYSNVIRILPPLITTKNMLITFLEIFDRVNSEIEKEYLDKVAIPV